MKKNYRKLQRASNAVDTVGGGKGFGKGAAGKGGRTTNSEIGERMIHRELKDRKKNKC